MHGLVNPTVEDVVRRGFSDAAWTRDSAADGVTYKRVGAAAEGLALDAAQVLEAYSEQ